MKAVKLVCPHCGATIDQDVSNRTEFFCAYCGGKIYFDDGVTRTEHVAVKEKTVNINKHSTKSFTDEAALQRAKNEKLSLKAGVVIFIISVVALLCALFAGYKYGTANRVVMPSNKTEISFRKAVLGKASEESTLIVLEQDISVESEIVKEGLFEWGVFEKNKEVTYCGKAVYTVNLKQIRENDIVIDTDRKTVTVYVPTPEMHDLVVEPNKFNLGKTSNGFLAFGDMKFTLEEAFYIESQAMESLKAEARSDSIIKKASNIATDKVKELFEKAITGVNSSYRLVIELY